MIINCLDTFNDSPMSIHFAKLKLLNLTKTIKTFPNKLAWVCKIIIIEYSVVDNNAPCDFTMFLQSGRLDRKLRYCVTTFRDEDSTLLN